MKNNGDFTPALIVKLILVLVFLLTAAFVSGVMIGKNGRRNVDRTSSDEEGINEKLSVCIFNSDELRGKYLKLRDAAREKGLVDENDVINMNIACRTAVAESVEASPAETSPETSPEERPESAEQKAGSSAEASPEASKNPEPAEAKQAEKKAETKPAETPVQTSPETSQQEKPKSAESKPAENKTIDEILTEKKAAPEKKADKKCRFSIQIASLDSPEQVAASQKQFKSLKTRVVSGESKGKKWYKIRSGCFDSREDAEAELPKVRSLKKDAFIVSE